MASISYRALSVNLPGDLADLLERLAAAENRSTGELVGKAIRQYWEQQIRQALHDSQEEFRRNNPMNYTEADVERLIDEYRAEQAAAASTPSE